MSITWGNVSFSGLESLSSWDAPSYGGVYAVMFRPDYKNKPSTYRILYFGEADKFDKRGIGSSHHKYNCWKNHANGNRLYIAIHRDDIDASRQSKEKRLIQQYTPSCNDEYT